MVFLYIYNLVGKMYRAVGDWVWPKPKPKPRIRLLQPREKIFGSPARRKRKVVYRDSFDLTTGTDF
jgi:hypothetical protein